MFQQQEPPVPIFLHALHNLLPELCSEVFCKTVRSYQLGPLVDWHLRNSLKGILQLIHRIEPLSFGDPVTPTTLAHHSRQPLSRRVCRPHPIVTTRGQAMHYPFLLVKLFFSVYPNQQARPQPIRSTGVIGQRRIITSSRYLDTHRSPVPS